MARAIESVSGQAEGKGIGIATSNPTVACIVAADEYLLEKAVVNLLQNAIAFAPAKGKVSATLQEQRDSIVLRVEDDGPGIPDFAQARMFERFFSLPRPDTGKKSSGLGLALVREIATLHRGSIELRNGASGGAIAELVLPRAISR